ncbi:MipA/OmpV family protein [Halomonas sp. SpR1]|uniref:MipA/OmpV family protein n=1 Tax=Halomonas sp. SpR1 TaxID=3050462 RepID=UPI0027E45950|nr:MipA/OmpV family protein [Halomonas sp. SpR1]MDQ7732105.1 MipA/OmpV family protein [Halomonas sp. SpR1]
MQSSLSSARCFDTAVIHRATAMLTIIGLALPLTALATGKQADGDSSWEIGLGVVSSQEAYTGMDSDIMPLPIVAFENSYIQLSVPELSVKLPSYELSDSNEFNFSIFGRYDFLGYEEGDARILKGMEDRDGGFWAGFKTEWQNSFADISAKFATEAAGDSKGSSFNLAIEKTWYFKENFMLTPRLAANWLDSHYIDYYYGVRKNEVTVGRGYYNGEAGVNVEIGVLGGYVFEQKHFVLLDVGITSLASEIKNSPLVDSSTESSIALGYLYRF